MSLNTEREITYPAELTIKAVFRTSTEIGDLIKSIYREMDVQSDIHLKKSSEGKFSSYTIVADYMSAEQLHNICSRISGLKGFMTMF